MLNEDKKDGGVEDAAKKAKDDINDEYDRNEKSNIAEVTQRE